MCQIETCHKWRARCLAPRNQCEWRDARHCEAHCAPNAWCWCVARPWWGAQFSRGRRVPIAWLVVGLVGRLPADLVREVARAIDRVGWLRYHGAPWLESAMGSTPSGSPGVWGAS